MTHNFEVLCIDLEHKVKFKKPNNFIKALSTIENLWNGNPDINENELEINDPSKKLKLNIRPFDTSKMATGERYASAFLIIIEGTYSHIEPFRIKIVEQLKEFKFSYIKILNDDVSDFIANKIYPHLNQIENLLRKYIVKFLLQKLEQIGGK